jgi:hypothetical protein
MAELSDEEIADKKNDERPLVAAARVIVGARLPLHYDQPDHNVRASPE